MLNPEVEATAIRRRADLEDDDLPGSVDLAKALGVTVRRVDPRLLRGSDACAIVLKGKPEIFVARRMPGARLQWVIAHEVAELHLQAIGYVGVDVELQADAIAAALVMPAPIYRVAIREHGIALDALASDFLVDQTAAAIRLAEVEAVDAAIVVTPHRVYSRTPDGWVAPPESEIRKGRILNLPGIEPIILTDARRRVAFVRR